MMILRYGMAPVLAGMACGCIASVFSGRLLAALFFGVNTDDGLVLSCAGFTLILIGTFANYIPASGAGRIDPVSALRNE
jgi:ABC-type antimicrobial peptide transport system permease subunit